MATIECFEIKNYKSIKESGKCYLDNYITILAGKNESGKTAILEALEDFNADKNIREEAIPIYDKNLKPQIELTVKLNKKDLNKIVEKFKIQNPKIDKLKLIIRKTYPNDYTISEESSSVFVSNKEELIRNISKLIKSSNGKVENPPLDENVLSDIRQRPNIKDYTLKFKENVKQKEQEKLNKEIEKLKDNVEELNSIKQFQVDIINFVKVEFVPNFILFSTFEDILPDQLSISEAQKNPLVKDLSLISNLDFAKIQPSAAPDVRKKHEEEVNIKFSKEYKLFWTQDHSRICFWWDSNNIYFRIKEGKEHFKPAIRSKGRQWHLAFYIRATARSIEEKNNLILIDEPGLFLHAKAQKDILGKLEECAIKNKLAYSTHSPYLIQTNKLARVRLITKNEKKGTVIEKITAKADKETLTPILTAIGEDLSIGIKTDKKNSIIVEGYSDYLYLLAFKKLLTIKNELNFVPATGGDTPIYVGSILFGWGLDPVFVLDNDKQGKNVRKKLQERLAIDDKKIILIPDEKEGSIENLFSEKDFKKYINDKSSNHGKVLLALQFFQRVENEEIKSSGLNEETYKNFQDLFKKLNKVME